MIREGIQKLIDGTNLTYEESCTVMTEVMSGKATNAQTAAFLTGLRIKGESVEELIAFASVMRNHCHQIHPKVQGRLVDTCGTGGDTLKTFNVSTTAAFVIAGAGVAVAKHGNRSVTSKSGSADVLEKLGLNLTTEPQTVQTLIEQIGVGFMFAPAFHPAMKYAMETRREIGVRTVFNLLGPLTNPASASAQLLGVYDQKLVTPITHALQKLGCDEAMVVHGIDGLDEISTIGKTLIVHLKNKQTTQTIFSPSDFGVKKADITELYCPSVKENAEILFNILNNKTTDAKRDVVLVNSAAGILIGGKANSFQEALELANTSIESGAAYKKLRELIKTSGGNLEPLETLETNQQ
ncbi:anthranilate phosphoribosyltransferase [Candidatus Bathycorpusculum sp.]|uniref:anthranilate phosphoribosyltransferase n=1 Tax=Candidatus Bathycorpusculum sp. TaxID=2994959 RepID=UPI0028248E0A|nr:anthranilate phosphoribosyltransferase [Candidatus Termitimicrobium sp.]MCL2685747.1 anthranilate phosphoribosyltransferase [Candidatus Termitimicrobium sp.]